MKRKIYFSLLLLCLISCHESQENTDKAEIKLPTIEKNPTSTEVYNEVKETNSKKFFSLSQDEQIRFQSSFLNEIYLCLMGKLPSSQIKQKWLNTLLQKGSREGIIRNIISSRPYREQNQAKQHFQFGDVEREFFLKFLGIKNLSEVAKKQNKPIFKKLLVEQILDLIDAYGNKNDELAHWYGQLSAYLAPNLDKYNAPLNKIRLNMSPDFHEAWAKSVHRDFIKTETVLKVCSILQ